MAKGLPGVTHRFNITVKNSNGAAVDLGAFDQMFAYVFIKPDRIIAQFALSSYDNYRDLIVLDAAAGEIQIVLDPKHTRDIAEETLYIICIPYVADEYRGTLDGKSYELIEITRSAKSHLPTIV